MNVYQEGRIKSWNDERGFGFIDPEKGGEAVFAHISAFESGRPGTSQRVRFLVEPGKDGRPRARKVQLLDVSSRLPRGGAQAVRGLGLKSQLFLAVFVACLLAAIVVGSLPWWIGLLYAGLSGVTFLVYGADKSAARAGAQRVSENTLHLLALVGGWPGALIAQQVLRHKSSKFSFLIEYWIFVVFNCAGCALLALPALRAWLLLWVRIPMALP